MEFHKKPLDFTINTHSQWIIIQKEKAQKLFKVHKSLAGPATLPGPTKSSRVTILTRKAGKAKAKS